MRTKFFCTNFLNTPRGPGRPGKIPGTSQTPLFETQGRQSFEGGHEVFGHHPFAWKTPTPPGGLRTQKVNLCALFSCLKLELARNFGRRKQNYSPPASPATSRPAVHPPPPPTQDNSPPLPSTSIKRSGPSTHAFSLSPTPSVKIHSKTSAKSVLSVYLRRYRQ